MKKSPLIAVIVPVYNGAPFLERCVKSVQAQTYTHWELFLVDDGSTDDSLSLCRQLAATDSRIHVIHQKNQGNTVARNTGINAALAEENADFIAFMDQDDWLPENAYQTLIGLHQRTGAEIVWGNVLLYKEGCSAPILNDCTDFPSNFLHYSLEDLLTTLSPWCWNKLYARCLINKEIRFSPDLALGEEDIDFVFRIAQHTNFIAYTEKPVYCYLLHQKSTSHQPNLARNKRAVTVWQTIDEYCLLHHLTRAHLRVLEMLTGNICAFFIAILLYDMKNQYTTDLGNCRHWLYHHMRQLFSSPRMGIPGKLFMIFPLLLPRTAKFIFRLPGIHTFLTRQYTKRFIRDPFITKH